jgi:hypothetical protein
MGGITIKRLCGGLLSVMLVTIFFISTCDVTNAIETVDTSNDKDFCNCEVQSQLDNKTSPPSSVKEKFKQSVITIIDEAIPVRPVVITLSLSDTYIFSSKLIPITADGPSWNVLLARSHL